MLFPENVFAAKKTELTKESKVIIISDSYSVKPKKARRWPYYVEKFLNTGQGQVILSAKIGSGFTKKGRFSFTKRLKKMVPDQNVRMVIVLGGVRNDLRSSKKKLYRQMKRFSAMVKKKFPNAGIYYGIPNYEVKKERIRERLLKRKRILKKYCRKLGWKYLRYTEKCLYKRKKNFSKDGHHLSKKGQKILGKNVIKDLKRYGIVPVQ